MKNLRFSNFQIKAHMKNKQASVNHTEIGVTHMVYYKKEGA